MAKDVDIDPVHPDNAELKELSLKKIIGLIERAKSYAENGLESVKAGSQVPLGKDYGMRLVKKLDRAIRETVDTFIEGEDEFVEVVDISGEVIVKD